MKKSSYKMAGVVFVVILVVVALLLIVFGKISINKKNTTTSTTTQQEVVKQTEQATTKKEVATKQEETTTKEKGTEVEETSSLPENRTSLIQLTDTKDLNYSSAELSTSGVVTSKDCYLQDNQVIYCISINIGVGNATELVHYYCTYSAYSSVSLNDILTVKYQQVATSAYSVISVSK